MYFHIDESGNTGNNLFDKNQPRLSYGVLSSLSNADVLCVNIHNKIKDEIGDEIIHANILGIGGLTKIAPHLIEIQKKVKFDFDYCFIDKITHALVMFFEAVFDAGLNDAVKWDVYWTPLRYLIIGKLTFLFDEDLLRESWRLCTVKTIERYTDDIRRLLSEIKKRAEISDLDDRSKELITDALNFGISNPLSLDFGCHDKKMLSPNAIGFQFVISSIARRTRKKRRKKASSIIVDVQKEFNKAQINTHYNLYRIAEGLKKAPSSEKKFFINHPLYTNFTEEEITHKGLSEKKITISKSCNSIGLQIVDVYLWIANKIISGASLSTEIQYLWSLFGHRSMIGGISLEGMEERFLNFDKMLPKFEELSDEQLEFAKASIEKHREKVQSLT